MIQQLLLVLFVGVSATSAAASEPCSATSGPTYKPLVELYTSEGCSSCPPADRWLSTQITRNDINLLAFHVDYWDSIGWPDRFASPSYSQRQRQRVDQAGGNSVYTPQVMVGANVSTSWSSENSFNKVLGASISSARPSLTLELQREKSAAHVILSAMTAGSDEADAQFWLAQYIDGQSSTVRAGENHGTTLHHDRVVRKLWGPWFLSNRSLSRTQAIDIPDGAWGLVAFVQDDHGNTLQSLGLPASACDKTSIAMKDGR